MVFLINRIFNMEKTKKQLKKDKNILYTGFGDKGTTTLFDCKQGRISKSSILVEALGSVDELNAYLGIIKVYSDLDKISLIVGKKKTLYSRIILDIQQTLFVIQAELGGSKMSVRKKELNILDKVVTELGVQDKSVKRDLDRMSILSDRASEIISCVDKIEKIINEIGEILPPITTFTISGGSTISAGLDFARTLSRKSERRIIAVVDEGSRKIGPVTISYMNRLSSVLFAMSRYVNYTFSILENHPNYNK